MSENAIGAGASPLEAAPSAAADTGTFAIVLSLSFCHLLNDTMQSLVPAIYPILKDSYHLDFAQIGLITLAFQVTASLLQPVVGLYTDRRPMPYSLAAGMSFTLVGLIMLSMASSYPVILVSAAMIGIGSSVFHPESSRIARMASGGRHGLAQSLFQVGGNAGSAIGPLLAAFIVLPRGQSSIIWFSAAALVAILVLLAVGNWFVHNRHLSRPKPRSMDGTAIVLSRRRVLFAVFILMALLFSKNVYSASLGSYYTFYLIHKFGLEVQSAQIALFAFLAALATGTLIGGWVGDKIGRIPVIWVSILGVLPFTLALPHTGLYATLILSVVIGLIMASAFSAILVYAQDLIPGKVGTVAGLFFGISFGLGGLGAAALGELADRTSIETVYQACAFLPAIGLLTIFLPRIETRRR